MNLRIRIRRRVMISLSMAAAVFLFFRGVSYDAPSIDHAKVIRGLNAATFKKGEQIYQKACATCHGVNGSASLPQARSFNKDPLRFGNRPYDMWKTISNGAGMMAAQTWLTAEERYYVIQYIRDEFIKPFNKKQYFTITDTYLATLPKATVTAANQQLLTRSEAKKGSLQYGQQWFSKTASDYGPALYTQLKDHSTSVLTVDLGRHFYLSYDLHRMKLAAAWKGKLNLSDTKFKLYRGEGQPFIDGTALKGLNDWHWTLNEQYDSLNRVTGIRQPLAPAFMQYKGHYNTDGSTVLSYKIHGRSILERPSVDLIGNTAIILQTLTVSAGTAQTVVIGKWPEKAGQVLNGAWTNKHFTRDSYGTPSNSILESRLTEPGGTSKSIFAAVTGDNKVLTWTIDDSGQLKLNIPGANKELTFTVIRCESSLQGYNSFHDFVQRHSSLPGSLTRLITDIRAVPKLYITVKGSLNAARPHFDPRYSKDKDKTAVGKLVSIPVDYPYTVDDITLPYNNTYNAWVRPTAVTFADDGRLFLTTYTGDLWMAEGVDEKLEHIKWQRIATGLYEPMGIRIIENKIFITCRNGIMKLHDLNNDGVIDYYEQYHPDQDVSSFFHAFNFGLETDRQGNMYYVKPGEYTDNKDPGNVIKVSPDGSAEESIATGFRVNNGITISPEDVIFVSDNQGNWTPANKINVIERGRYYGYVPNLASGGWSPDGRQFPADKVKDGVISSELVPVPASFTQPALWMPQEIDNSPGGGTWSDKSWGPLGSRFIHTSYGTGWTYYILPKKVDTVWQASMIALPFQFDAGIQRAAVNPVDKQVYVTGLTGWDDGVARKYGTLARIRYTGGSGHFADDVNVSPEGIDIRFNFRVDSSSIKPDDFDISMWNYKWTSNYGSAHYSVNEPGKEGQDNLKVASISSSSDMQGIRIILPGLKVANTVRIRMKVKASDGAILNETIYLTINKIAGQ